jgi:predicted MFS family arabinose efflux permease
MIGVDPPVRRAAISAVTTTLASVMPVFLVGGLAVQISRDLALTPAALGLAVAVYFGVTAVASVPVGALVERFGAKVTAQAAILLAADAMLAVAISARTLAALLVMLAIGAAANALGQLASNSTLSHYVPKHRHGLVFGAKQAAVPLATLLAGVSVPAVALTIGWRWAFVLGALVALMAVPLVPPDPPPRPAGQRRREPPGAGLLLVGFGAAFGAAAATSIGAFLVGSLVAQGISESRAGLMLTLAGAACVCGRLGVGVLADRFSRGHLAIVGGMLVVGAAGTLLFTMDGLSAVLFGVAFGYGVPWAFPGLLTYSVVKLRPSAPAAATSVTQTGVFAGNCLGPLGFGLLVTQAGFDTAWRACAVAMAVAAVLVFLGAALAQTRRTEQPELIPV